MKAIINEGGTKIIKKLVEEFRENNEVRNEKRHKAFVSSTKPLLNASMYQ